MKSRVYKSPYGRIRVFFVGRFMEGLFILSFRKKKGYEKMKNTKKIVSSLLCVLLALTLTLCFFGCNKIDNEGLWENATYRKDKTFGDGEKTITVQVKAGDDSVTFTIKTDKETVGDALMEHKLIDGEDGAYGLYVKKVNGILADYDVDQSYWAFYINGEYAMSGVDVTDIDTSATYKLEYTK